MSPPRGASQSGAPSTPVRSRSGQSPPWASGTQDPWSQQQNVTQDSYTAWSNQGWSGSSPSTAFHELSPPGGRQSQWPQEGTVAPPQEQVQEDEEFGDAESSDLSLDMDDEAVAAALAGGAAKTRRRKSKNIHIGKGEVKKDLGKATAAFRSQARRGGNPGDKGGAESGASHLR